MRNEATKAQTVAQRTIRFGATVKSRRYMWEPDGLEPGMPKLEQWRPTEGNIQNRGRRQRM